MDHDEIVRVSLELDEILKMTHIRGDEEKRMVREEAALLEAAAAREDSSDGPDIERQQERQSVAKRQVVNEADKINEVYEESHEKESLKADYAPNQQVRLEENGPFEEINRQTFRDKSPVIKEAKIGGVAVKSRRHNPQQHHKIKKGGFSKSLVRPSDGLTAAFLVPVLIMVIIFVQRGIFPFGEESFLRTDMYHQYAPFFSEFQHKLATGSSLFYSWDIGMGVNFAALYAYYLASPLNWLLVFVPKDYIIEFMTYSIVLKIGLCGLSFAYYLRKHEKSSDFGIAFFGIFYALSGYMAAYSWNIMWLDCILLFPLIVLGLEQLVREKKGFLYCIALGISILSNYYISIMICIFMVLYFISLLILEGKRTIGEWLINIGQFSVYSLVAGGLAAVVLLPEIFALQITASGDFNFPKSVSFYFSIFDMIARHIGNVDIEIGLDHWPNIYCGVAVFLLFLLFLVEKKISLKEKVVYCSLLFLFFASFAMNVLNFIWHGFHYPNSLPCRQSFIYIFIMLLICYKAYVNLKELPYRHLTIAFFASAGFVILAEKLVEQDHFEPYVFYVAIIFLAIYAGLMYLYKKGSMNINLLILLTLGVVSIEAAVNTTITSVTTTSRTAYTKDNKEVEKLVSGIAAVDQDFYRIEKITRKTKNDGAWMNFPSVSLFSSTANADLTEFFKAVGCEGNTNAYSITGSTPLVDMLFSVKYALYSQQPPESDMLKMVAQEENTYLYENVYTLPLGFLVAPDFEDNWQRDYGNPVTVQNDLCDVIGTDQVLIQAEGITDGQNFRFTPDETGDYYVYVSKKSIEKVTATIGSETKTFNNINRGFILELGRCIQGEEVLLHTEEEGEVLEAKAYRFDSQALADVWNTLNKNPLVVTNWGDAYVEGYIDAQKYGVLFTSIPFDKGWKVYVDGERRTPRKSLDTFLSVDVPEGRHSIRMEYVPEGLKTGALITGGCIVFLLAVFIGRLIQNRKKKKGAEFFEQDKKG